MLHEMRSDGSRAIGFLEFLGRRRFGEDVTHAFLPSAQI